MSHPQTHPDTLNVDPSTLQTLEDWRGELKELNPLSYEYQQISDAIGVLATEAGVPFGLEDTQEQTDIPPGYISINRLPDTPKSRAHLDIAQFDAIYSFALPKGTESLSIPLTELVTDGGKRVRIGDLRPFMTESVKKGGLRSEAENKKLDEAVFRDVKQFLDEGKTRYSVVSVHKVAYSKVNGTKIRGYWMPARDDKSSEAIPTFVRIADSGNDVHAEGDLYTRVFKQKFRT